MESLKIFLISFVLNRELKINSMNLSKIEKHFVTLLLLFMWQSFGYSLNAANDPSSLLSDEIMAERIAAATDLVEGKYTPVVKTYLKNHITRYPQATEKLIGKKSMYFPLFEEVLFKNGLPDDLKFLPVIESGLNPTARSYVGATGLWQFMAGTAKLQGLKMNEDVDERKNPVRATEAAISHLKKLYGIYEDWALVLAAYNSGPGNVNRAIKKANSRDFWEIRPYLPKETREYVPTFLAVSYLFKNYMLHDLSPVFPELDYQITSKIKVHDHLSFADIAEWTNISIDIIKKLNPGFKKNYIPASYSGYVIILPKRIIKVLKHRLLNAELINTDSIFSLEGSYNRIVFEAFEGDKLEEIAEHFNINPYNIYDWNGRHLGDVFETNTEIVLFVYELKEGLLVNKNYFRTPRVLLNIDLLPSLMLTENPPESFARQTYLQSTLKKIGSSPSNIYWIHQDNRKRIKLHKGQSLKQALQSIPSNISLDQLLALNNLESLDEIKIGATYFIE